MVDVLCRIAAILPYAGLPVATKHGVAVCEYSAGVSL